MIAKAAPVATPKPVLPVIEQFRMAPVQGMDPGTELKFTLKGAPNAKAGFSIEGVAEKSPSGRDYGWLGRLRRPLHHPPR
ncbi:MAG: hypothetical protein HY028_06710 [Gammaproteobacteria bacterium]|nr:hypothetical protein [Gammaproteobacteria bacterium]